MAPIPPTLAAPRQSRGAPRYGPPLPPNARTAPAKPWRSSILRRGEPEPGHLVVRSPLLPGLGDLREVVRRFFQDERFLLASALSFDVILCLAPFTLILFSVAGFLLASSEITEYVLASATVVVTAYARQLAEFLVVLT